MKKLLLTIILAFAQFIVFSQKKLIWTVLGGGELETCNIDGTNLQSFVSSSGSSGGLTVDQQNSEVYWTVSSFSSPGMILKTDFNAQSIDTLVTGIGSPENIVLDIENSKMYWSDRNEDKIQRANLDGSDVEDVYSVNSLNPMGLFIDTELQQLYFSRSSGFIGKVSVDVIPINPDDIVTIVTASGLPTNIAVDLNAQKLYWSNQDFFGESKIQRCNIDGSGVEDLVTGLGNTYGLALDIEEQKIYWTDWGTDFPIIIKKANTDGSNVENVIEIFGHTPYDLALINDFSMAVNQEFNSALMDVKLFPNPSDGILTITGDNDKLLGSFLRFIDVNGKVIKEVDWHGQNIGISDFPDGIYLLQIETDYGRITKKIIKK